MKQIILLSFVLLLIASAVKAKHITGVLKSEKDWTFIDRFCFLPLTGTLQFNFRYQRHFMVQSLLLYWDKPNMWSMVYSNSSMTCAQKESLLDIHSYQIFRLDPDYGICAFDDNESVVLCKSQSYKFYSSRERWWFLAISNCLGKYGLQLEYDIYMRNGNPGELFREHFSADEIYILEFNIAFLLIEFCMVFIVVVVSGKLAGRQMLHSTYKIFVASVLFLLASIFFTCISYLRYAIIGRENIALKLIGSGLYAISQILLVNMLLLLSLGYTVVCGRLPHWGVVCLSIFMTSFVIAYIALYIVEAATFDPALVLYRYESWPGYAIIGIILASWLFYVCACIFTMAKHKKKAPFYAPMLAFYSLWFIAIPVTVAVNMTQVPDYSRAKVVNFIEVISLFLAHGFYLILTWPSLANKNFPFHIRTTQIADFAFEADEQEQDRMANPDLADGRRFTDFSIFDATQAVH